MKKQSKAQVKALMMVYDFVCVFWLLCVCVGGTVPGYRYQLLYMQGYFAVGFPLKGDDCSTVFQRFTFGKRDSYR